jgi:hypothetical protein
MRNGVSRQLSTPAGLSDPADELHDFLEVTRTIDPSANTPEDWHRSCSLDETMGFGRESEVDRR